ncbi:MAG: DUF4032 domain-containing protein [Corynebacterium sp.]|uniref:DUF4032 domain-containing protein n=1 Tax=Corynebacterium sp. TaxID=1720 RepID=UPI0026DA956C|nr:DUF4032 domain-containing protein [Corynebacterium sp.]MDO4761750.1 DUF4032 domain-containing protein [Corynebacterium sp.]
MKNSMNIATSAYAPSLITLPWETPLEHWPNDVVVPLPRGISRHIVRFVHLDNTQGTSNATRGTDPECASSPSGGIIAAVKEIGRKTAHHEYAMLRELRRIGAPCVTPIAVITGRRDTNGDTLTAALVTEHLRFSLPYREIFSRELEADMANKLIKALAILLVRLHLNNFYWGDVSLSNTLFRRDADTFTAYLVDAETGEFQPQLSQARRLYDVDIARVNIIGELMDLASGGKLDENLDPIQLGNRVETYYLELWHLLTDPIEVPADEYWRVQQRVDTLADIGFDVTELQLLSGGSGTITATPANIDAGHHRNQLIHLIGLDVEEQQARRLLSEITANNHTPIDEAARTWYTNEYLPTINAIPDELKHKLEPAQIFHEILDHRYYLSQEHHTHIPLTQAAQSYYAKVLPTHRDEAILITTEQDDGYRDDYLDDIAF